MTDTAVAPQVEAPPESGTRSRRLRIVRYAGWTLIWLGALTIGFVVHALFITTWLAQQNQPEMAVERLQQWQSTEITEVVVEPTVGATAPAVETIEPVAGATELPRIAAGATGRAGDGIEIKPLVLQVESPPKLHRAFALIRIPKIERLREGWNVVEGVGVRDLKTGAGHMPNTALPGQPGNAVISGHRTTYGAPFSELDILEPGDRIEVDTAIGTHVYEVREVLVVKPTDVWVTDPRPGAWLTLTTCNPKFSARQRLVIVAELIGGPNAEVIAVTS